MREIKRYILKNLKFHKDLPLCWLYTFASIYNIDVNEIEDILTDLKKSDLVEVDIIAVHWKGKEAETIC